MWYLIHLEQQVIQFVVKFTYQYLGKIADIIIYLFIFTYINGKEEL